MNPFFLSPEERLADWKALRTSLANLPEDLQLSTVATYWSRAPLLTMAHDCERPQDLPTPWEMISEGNWCRQSVAIGMEFTLRLAGWSADRLRLQMIRDYDESEVFLLLIIDGEKVLNYNHGTVTEYPTSRHDITGRWAFSGKFYRSVD